MPELPEVETLRSYLEAGALGRKINHVEVREPRILKDTSTSRLGSALAGSCFTQTARRGKYLLVSTDRDCILMLHFGMNGGLAFADESRPFPPWSRVAFLLDPGEYLHYLNKRLLGRVSIFNGTDINRIPEISRLGPEPLDPSFDCREFVRILDGRKTTIHQALMNQQLIAGIGNIYSDEITFQAGVRPDRKVFELGPSELERLFESMKSSLDEAVRLSADLDRRREEFLIPHRKPGGRCPLDHGPLVMIRIGGRSSYYCPVCQS